MLTVTDNHSVDLDRLLPGGTVLDVGARGFVFARYFAERGHAVWALDPDPEVEDPKIPGVHFIRAALMADPNPKRSLVLTSDVNARYVSAFGETLDGPSVTVEALDLETLMEREGIAEWDLVKLNCEGAEFDILDRLRAPVARQIVVSFHEHTGRRRGERAINELIARLGRWYDVLRHEWDERYGCSPRNAWDTVLVKR